MAILSKALACFLLSCPCAVASWANEAMRRHVEGVATAIERNYFDAGKGRDIADDLRAAAGRGEFDAQTDPKALAIALTRRLRPLDRHFTVRWIGETSGPTHRAPMRPAPERDGSGVSGVEVLPGDIGYLAVREFADFDFDDRDAPARKAMDSALRRLSGTRAMIVDLRENHGGSPAMVGYLVSAFVAPGANVYNAFHTRKERFSEAPKTPYPRPRTDVPLYVLVDRGTASAAEAFAYTVKHAGRATLVGAQTAGAANPGEYFDAGDGFGVFVATGSPTNPVTGGNWEGKGVEIDVETTSSTALEVALQRIREAGR